MTAEKLVEECSYQPDLTWEVKVVVDHRVIELMIEFARYHVKEALRVAFEDVPIGGSDNINYEDVAIIKNRYPLEKIK